jgi:hypothetical protein
MSIDFSTADEQGSRDLIPDGAIVAVNMAVTRGGEGPDGFLTKSKLDFGQKLGGHRLRGMRNMGSFSTIS